MLLVESRRPPATGPDGSLVLLADQDRAPVGPGADRRGAGASCAGACAADRPGPYQIQAAINAVHSDAPTAAATDWPQILRALRPALAIAPGPVVALNRAVAVAEVHGPAIALVLVDELGPDRLPPVHAIRADLLRRLGRTDEAADAYRAAAEHTENTAERDFLTGQASTARRASDGVIP